MRAERFAPVRVEGATGVLEVAVWPDRIELLSGLGGRVVRLVDIARFPRPRFVWRLAFRLGLRPKWLPVGERDWCKPRGQQYFRFYTSPPLTVFVPASEVEEYGSSVFRRIQEVLRSGGFHTVDEA